MSRVRKPFTNEEWAVLKLVGYALFKLTAHGKATLADIHLMLNQLGQKVAMEMLNDLIKRQLGDSMTMFFMRVNGAYPFDASEIWLTPYGRYMCSRWDSECYATNRGTDKYCYMLWAEL